MADNYQVPGGPKKGAYNDSGVYYDRVIPRAAGADVSASNPFPVSLNGDLGAGEYEAVEASATARVLGGTGAVGDYLDTVWVFPATTSPGNVIILDGNTAIATFAGGSNSVSNLVPFPISLGIKSVNGAFKITTGANVSVLASGNFSA